MDHPSASSIQELPAHELAARLQPLLASVDSQIPAVRQILTRLSTEQDDEATVKMLLHLLSNNITAPHPSLIEELLDLLGTISRNHLHYIDCLAKLVETPQQASIVLNRYQDLVTTDRRLLVPVIGSLGDFPLNDAQKRKVFHMTVEALSVVEEEDIPAVVRTLLASMTRDTAKTIVAAIRAATVDMKNAALLLEIILNAMRIRPYAVQHFLSQISSSVTPLSKLDVLLLLGLISRHQNKPLVEKAVISSATLGSLTLETLKSTLLDHDIVLPMLPSVIALLSALLNAVSENPQLLHWVLDLYAFFFANYERHSVEALSLLLSCLASTIDSHSSLSTRALTAARVLLALLASSPASLVPYMHLFEEVLYDSTSSLHVELLQPLCHLLASLCAFKEGAQNSLQIFIGKTLFAGARLQQRAGLVLAAHLLKHAALSTAAQEQLLVESVLRVMPCAESHPVAMLHLFDVLLYNLPNISNPILLQHIFEGYLQPLCSKARIFRGAPILTGGGGVVATSAAAASAAAGIDFNAAITVLHLSEQSMKSLGATSSISHPLYYSLLLRTTGTLFASLKPREAVGVLARLVELPIEAGALAEKLIDEGNNDGIADDVDEAFIAECVFACFHSFSLLVTLLSLLVDCGGAPSHAASCRALAYRQAMHVALAALSKSSSKASTSNNGVSLNTHSRVFHSLPSFADSLVSTSLAVSLFSILLASSDLRTTRAAADVAGLLANRSNSVLTNDLSALPSVHGYDWCFCTATSSIALARPPLQELVEVLPRLRLVEQLSVRFNGCKELWKNAAKSKAEADVSLLAANMRLIANILYFILSLLDASNQAMPVILHRHQQQQQELIAALTSSPTTNTNDIAEPRQRLYDQLAAFFASTDDQATALLLLQSLVSLTRGTRKARDVGGLFHSVLSTVYPSTEIASLKDILPLDLLLPTTAFAKSPLRVRAGMTAKDFTAIVLRHCIRAQVVLMRGAVLATSLSEVAGAAIALVEAGLPHHPHLRCLDDFTISPISCSLFEVATVMLSRAAPSLDGARTPYGQLIDSLRAFARALRVFLAMAEANKMTSSLYAQASTSIALSLPIAQRRLSECIDWRSSFPHGVVDERLLSLNLLASPLAAAHTCVILSRRACQVLKEPAAKGRRPLASVPRAIQRTEALYCFLENLSKTHHVAASTDDEFASAWVMQGEENNGRAHLWQPEDAVVGGEEGGALQESYTDTPAGGESEADGAADESNDDDDEGTFKLVQRKRKAGAGGDAAAQSPPKAPLWGAAEESDEEEAYTIVVTRPKPRLK